MKFPSTDAARVDICKCALRLELHVYAHMRCVCVCVTVCVHTSLHDVVVIWRASSSMILVLEFPVHACLTLSYIAYVSNACLSYFAYVANACLSHFAYVSNACLSHFACVSNACLSYFVLHRLRFELCFGIPSPIQGKPNVQRPAAKDLARVCVCGCAFFHLFPTIVYNDSLRALLRHS